MNLVVASLSWSPSQPRTGDPVGFTAVIRNIGDRTTENGHGGIGVSFLVDGNEVDWVYCSNDPPLLPGGQRTCVADQFDGQTKKWQATAGSHRVSAFVDDLGSFAETNEGDNTLTRTLTVA
jgi:hypothetical protein